MQHRITKEGKVSKNGKTSKYPDVSESKNKTWLVRKTINGKQMAWGTYKTQKKAHQRSKMINKRLIDLGFREKKGGGWTNE